MDVEGTLVVRGSEDLSVGYFVCGEGRTGHCWKYASWGKNYHSSFVLIE